MKCGTHISCDTLTTGQHDTMCPSPPSAPSWVLSLSLKIPGKIHFIGSIFTLNGNMQVRFFQYKCFQSTPLLKFLLFKIKDSLFSLPLSSLGCVVQQAVLCGGFSIVGAFGDPCLKKLLKHSVIAHAVAL